MNQTAYRISGLVGGHEHFLSVCLSHARKEKMFGPTNHTTHSVCFLDHWIHFWGQLTPIWSGFWAKPEKGYKLSIFFEFCQKFWPGVDKLTGSNIFVIFVWLCNCNVFLFLYIDVIFVKSCIICLFHFLIIQCTSRLVHLQLFYCFIRHNLINLCF